MALLFVRRFGLGQHFDLRLLRALVISHSLTRWKNWRTPFSDAIQCPALHPSTSIIMPHLTAPLYQMVCHVPFPSAFGHYRIPGCSSWKWTNDWTPSSPSTMGLAVYDAISSPRLEFMRTENPSDLFRGAFRQVWINALTVYTYICQIAHKHGKSLTITGK